MLMSALIAQPSCTQTEEYTTILIAHLNFCLYFVVLVHKLKPFNCLLCTIAIAAISTEIVVVLRFSHTNYLLNWSMHMTNSDSLTVYKGRSKQNMHGCS